MKPFAVVVLNWNGVELLEKFVPLWLEYAETNISDLIIVDNGSTDSSVHFLETNYPTIELIKFPENKGYAGGYNDALELIKQEYVVLLNSDATPKDESWLVKPLELFQNNQNIVAIQPKIKAYNNPNYFEYAGAAGGYLDCLGYPYCKGRVLNIVEEDRGQYEESETILWASGAALMIRRKEFLKVGGFDKRFFAHQEEIDLCVRLRSQGFDIVYAPKSEVFHIGGATLDSENPRKLYLNYRNNLLMLYKNLNTFHLIIILIIRLCLDFTLGFLYFLKGEKEKSKAIFKAYYHCSSLYSDFRQDREENLSKQKLSTSKLFTSFILLKYLKIKA